MQLLVCGMHRSGTSAVAHMLARSCGRTLLEDPDWAMTGRLIDVAPQSAELTRYDMVKCPRMTEVLPQVLAAHTRARAAVLVRDPRDVLSSILEKVHAGMPTRMLEFTRLGVPEQDVGGFARAYSIYARTVLDTVHGASAPRVRIVVYEKFWGDKLGTIERLARWLGWPYDHARVEAVQGRQLGPAHTKHHSDQSIKGAGRWTQDLSVDQLAALAPGLDAYAELRAAADASPPHTLERLAEPGGDQPRVLRR